jgi:hypothetical protein
MQYLDKVVKETQRVIPVVPVIARTLDQDLEIGKVFDRAVKQLFIFARACDVDSIANFLFMPSSTALITECMWRINMSLFPSPPVHPRG